MAEKKVIEIEVKADKAVQNVDKLNDSLEKTSANTEDLTDEVTKNGGAMAILNQLTGGLAQQFKDSYEAIAVSTKGLSGFRKALVATGIGAAVVAIGLLVENWDKLKEIIAGTTRAQKAYKESIDKIVGSVTEMNTKIIKMEDTIQLAKEGFISKEDALKQYNEALGESFGYAQSLNEAEALMVANSAIVIENTKLKAQAEVLYAKAAEGRAKVLAGDESLQPDFWQTLKAGFLGFNSIAITTAINMESVLSNIKETLDVSVELENEAEKIQRQILENEKQLKTGSLSPDAVKKLQEKNQKLKEDLKKEIDDSNASEIEAEKAKAEALESIRQSLIDTEAEERAERLRQIQSDYDKQIELARQFYGVASLEVLALREAQQNALNEQQAIFDQQDQDRQNAVNAANVANKKAIADQLAQIEADKRAAQMQTLDQAISIADQESALGKALLIAKQVLAAREAIIDARATAQKAAAAVTGATIKASEAGVAVASGAAETAKIGFPQNIPMLIAYAAQAVGIIASIKAATSKMKSAAPSIGISPSISAPSAAPVTAPQISTVGSSGINQLSEAINNRPIKAFVVSRDVSTAQEMDRNIVTQAGI